MTSFNSSDVCLISLQRCSFMCKCRWRRLWWGITWGLPRRCTTSIARLSNVVASWAWKSNIFFFWGGTFGWVFRWPPPLFRGVNIRDYTINYTIRITIRITNRITTTGIIIIVCSFGFFLRMCSGNRFWLMLSRSRGKGLWLKVWRGKGLWVKVCRGKGLWLKLLSLVCEGSWGGQQTEGLEYVWIDGLRSYRCYSSIRLRGGEGNSTTVYSVDIQKLRLSFVCVVSWKNRVIKLKRK